MFKRYLLAPGPTPVPPEVLLAMAMPIIHHRAPELLPVIAERLNEVLDMRFLVLVGPLPFSPLQELIREVTKRRLPVDFSWRAELPFIQLD